MVFEPTKFQYHSTSSLRGTHMYNWNVYGGIIRLPVADFIFCFFHFSTLLSYKIRTSGSKLKAPTKILSQLAGFLQEKVSPHRIEFLKLSRIQIHKINQAKTKLNGLMITYLDWKGQMVQLLVGITSWDSHFYLFYSLIFWPGPTLSSMIWK